MAQPYCTGPVDAWVSFPTFATPGGALATPVFLGHGQRGPRISISRGWDQLYCDLSGSQIPFDLIYSGQRATVVIELSRFNEATLEALQAMPLPAGGGVGITAPFLDAGADRGSLMLSEGLNPCLWLRFPFSLAGAFPHPAMGNAVNGPLPAGLRFPGALFRGPDDRQSGTGANTVNVSFEALAVFNPSFGTFLLADFNMTGTGTIN